VDWQAILVTAVTSGALVAVINAIANRHKAKAEAEKIRAEGQAILKQIEQDAGESVHKATVALYAEYQDRLKMLDEKADKQDEKIEKQSKKISDLTCEVDTLHTEIKSRDRQIQELEVLKQSQQKEIEKLQLEVKERDRKIAEQTATITSLANRITILEGELRNIRDQQSGGGRA